MPRWIYVPCSGSLVIGQGLQLSDIRTLARIDTGLEVSSICLWEDEFRYPEKQNNPSFYHNVVADGILVETQV